MIGSGEKLPPGTLCSVCNDLATGNHYNVASCSGCKTFFRRCVVNGKNFVCIGNGNCAISKDVRCACRACRFKKCLAVGMDRSAIQNDRDRIGYTKRTRKKDRNDKMKESSTDRESPFNVAELTPEDLNSEFSDDTFVIGDAIDSSPTTSKSGYEPILERLAELEHNFSLLLSRGHIEPYASLDEALSASSILSMPINIKITDPLAAPHPTKEQCQLPFWRSRIIALYIDWAKTFCAFRKLPYADKVALITNHASSYMIMCEAFRTPEHHEPSPIVSPDLISDEQDPSFTAKKSVHTIFDPALIKSGSSCHQTGVRSIVDVPPNVHYPTVGNLSGLAPVMAVMIDYVLKPFRRMGISTTEFATLQAIMFFDPDTDGLDSASQRNVAIEQKKFLTALHRHILSRYDPLQAAERYSLLLLRIPTIRKVAAKKNESLQIIDMFNLFTLSTLVKETTLGIRQPPQQQLDRLKL